MPRTLNLNLTSHNHGLSRNLLDATVRIEGAYEHMLQSVLKRASPEDLLKRLMSAPQQLIQVAQAFLNQVGSTI